MYSAIVLLMFLDVCHESRSRSGWDACSNTPQTSDCRESCTSIPGAASLALLALSLVLSTFASAQSTWTVGATHQPIRIHCEGTVEISRASVLTIRTGSPDALVSWMGPDGRQAGFGEELLRLDTRVLQAEHQALLEDLIVMRRETSNTLVQLDKKLAEEEEEVAVLLEDLQTQVAEARAAGKPDPDRMAMLRREIDLARREAELQDKEVRRLQNLFEFGELARVELEDARRAAGTTRRRIRITELALDELGDGSDPVLARRAAWEVERARTTIGVDENNQLQPDRGRGRKLEAVRSKIKRKRAALQQALTTHEILLQTKARAAWPHLPLKELRILREKQVICRLSAKNPDALAPYTPKRKSGWVYARTTEASQSASELRDQKKVAGAPLPMSGVQSTPHIAPSSSALVIRGTARWRCDLPPGTCDIEFDLGDDAEWSCLSVRHETQALVALNVMFPGQSETVKTSVEIGADGLQLDFGLPEKAVLAEVPGAVKYQTWIGLARPIHNNPPALYLTPTPELLVRLRVHHLQLPFFKPSAAATQQIELKARDGEWVLAGRVRITDDPVSFFPDADENERDQADDQPEERTAREVTVAIPRDHSGQFAYAAHTTCRVTATPHPNTLIVPAHLVHEAEDGLFVKRQNQAVQVWGTRYDQYFGITRGLRSGDPLSMPSAPGRSGRENRYTGEVQAGAAVPMVVPTYSWARIESLLPHGSRVQKGEVVITLYRPRENADSVKAETKAVVAETTFLEAADEQYAAFLRQTAAHAQSVQEEKLAADRVAENRRLDQSVLAGVDEAERAAEEELAQLNQRVASLVDDDVTRIAYEEIRRQRDVLQLETQRLRLDRVAAFRSTDYTNQIEDQFAWHRARTELALRESKLTLNLMREEILSQRARSTLENNLQDRNNSRDFETLRHLRAPASGHVFYKRGYNDLARRRERIDKEFIVWNGLTVAEILDMDNLSFTIRLPEWHYHRIREGMELPIELDDLGGRLLPGRVITKGRSLYVPPSQDTRNRNAIRLLRVFDVKLKFAVPEDLRDQIRPGLRGTMTLP